MSWPQTYGLFALLLVGCSESPRPQVVVEKTVTVRTANNEEKTVSPSELYDHATGEPAYESVLVIDRQAQRKAFISLDQVTGETQANARYMLVTSSKNAKAGSDD